VYKHIKSKRRTATVLYHGTLFAGLFLWYPATACFPSRCGMVTARRRRGASFGSLPCAGFDGSQA